MKSSSFEHNDLQHEDAAFSLPGSNGAKPSFTVPFMRPELGEEEIEEVVRTLRSGWLTTGPKTRRFEKEFADAVNASYAVGVNSCTAALHLAVEAVGLRKGQAVLVPTMTFAATAEIVLYRNAYPILVDCDPETGNMDLVDARRKIEDARNGRLPFTDDRELEIVGIIPVHVGGFMLDIGELSDFADEFGLWIVEDAAHAFPAAWRNDETGPWQRCGDDTAMVTCYSFYANKTITTGEGGMAVTNNRFIAEKMRLLSLHGLSRDAWKRFSGDGSWDYRIVLSGYKYNLTDIASAIGIHQLARAESLRLEREHIAMRYIDSLAEVEEIELPPLDDNRILSWHLFPIRLNLARLKIDRNAFIEEMKKRGVGYSVHWRPLHMHPFYTSEFGWQPKHLPTATQLWPRLVSLPIFPGMSVIEIEHVIRSVRDICSVHSKERIALVA